ncbi:MAG: ribonuclease E/G, partial [Acidimicrobiia bacterium]|nr:ribonuclease E/G [Acidimicrobiia bacterium]
EHFTPDFRRLMIDDPEAETRVKEYLQQTAPHLLSKVQHYEDADLALFERFHVEDQLRKALDRKVWLPSGGHLIVDRTEALTVIDVNTGKFVGKSNLEETVLQNNLEAAEEIGRQLRLRDIGGIIVIDFIDMEIEKNRRAVLRRLRETLAKDKTRTQVFDVSNLGLVEMTRKNVSEGLLESFSDVCPTCNGRGVLLHEEAATVGAPVNDHDGDD